MLSQAALLTAAAACLGLLAGCGFHLRESVEIPDQLQSTYLESQDRYIGVTAELRIELQAAGAEVVEDIEAATGVIRIIAERSYQRVLSVGSAGRASEYELFEEVSFAVKDPHGKVLLKPQTLRLTRDLVFDDTQLLGKVSEAEVIRRQMQRNLARQIMTRIEVGMRGR